MLTVTDLLGIDVDNKGLAETIESVTNSVIEMQAVHDAIGRAIFLDGGLLEAIGGIKDPHEFIADIAFNSARVMNMLCYSAQNNEAFMKRLNNE